MNAQTLAMIIPAGEQAYAYDAYSNAILDLTDAERVVLKGVLDGLDRDRLIERVRARLPATDPEAAVDEFFRRSEEPGVFRQVPVRVVAPPPSRDRIRHELEDHIMSASLEVTQDCSLRCQYCHFTGIIDGIPGHNPKRMSKETARRAADFLLEHSTHLKRNPAISFYGGEPLLAVDVIESTIEHVRSVAPERGCTFHLTTNGLALNQASVRAFLAREEVSILVSVDGPPHLHDTFRVDRQGKGSHDRISRGLKALLDEHPEYYSTNVAFNAVVVSPEHYRDTVDFFQDWPLARAARKNAVRYSGVDLLGHEKEASDLQTLIPAPTTGSTEGLEAVREAFVQNRMQAADPGDGLDRYAEEILVRIAQREVGPIPPEVIPRGYCIPGARKLFVSVDGHLGTCEKVGRRDRIGTLDEGLDIDRIHAELSELHSMWTASCSGCLVQRFCGACPATISTCDGELSARRFRGECEGQKALLPEAIKDFVAICTTNPEYFERLKAIEVV